MCCLKYEQDAYEDLIRTSPKPDSFVDTPDGRGTVVEVDLLRQRVKVRMEENPETIGVYANTDIAVLRSGKAKKNDPPIPADLAPISGSGKRVRQERAEEKLTLEPIRFRYSTESVVEEAKPEAREPAEPAPARQSSRSRRRRPPQESGQEAAAGQPQKPEKETKLESSADSKPPRRRPGGRRRRPPKTGNEG